MAKKRGCPHDFYEVALPRRSGSSKQASRNTKNPKPQNLSALLLTYTRKSKIFQSYFQYVKPQAAKKRGQPSKSRSSYSRLEGPALYTGLGLIGFRV